VRDVETDQLVEVWVVFGNGFELLLAIVQTPGAIEAEVTHGQVDTGLLFASIGREGEVLCFSRLQEKAHEMHVCR